MFTYVYQLRWVRKWNVNQIKTELLVKKAVLVKIIQTYMRL